ncbi:serine/threonine-protein kinase [Streptomyces niveus]|uniref:non-specific serine/threonine protein kinase n=1 Tax=Streptomyces niveus TaxID=193462 RepID=A0A1U9QZC2_STRNV|nr:serine/threonine-protein kinase [Streptomyces niveus]AQU69161.1 serine/threonine protein kinase [Streptomyces niveus]
MTGGAENRIIDGRFELLERLGSGGMGTVWRARDAVLQREVALKEVRSPDAATAAATPRSGHVLRERVLREARALARISHPHVVTIHHIVDVGPHPWIVMELLSGDTLQDRLARGALTPVEAAGIGRQVLSALRAAHAVGIQHRDVKPSNVMLRADGGAVLTDFGIAALQGSTSLTATGELIGSPEYFAPERIRGHDDDPASDLWSLGVMLYVCVEGVSPLRRATSLATLAAVLDEPLPPPVRSGPLASVLNALLVRDPAARPDAARLDLMLAQVESGTAPEWAWVTVTEDTPPPSPVPAPTTVSSPPPGSVPATVRPDGPERRGGRTPTVVAAVAVAVALVAATALVFALRDDPGSPSAGKTGGTGDTGGSSATDSAPSPGSDGKSPSAGTGNNTGDNVDAGGDTPSSDDLTGNWVAQLASTEKSAGPAARERQADALRGQGITNARYLDSDNHASLKPGYWMFYVSGFGSGSHAVDWCRTRGLDSNSACVGRYVSDEPADRQYLCSPAPGGGTEGRCVRD